MILHSYLNRTLNVQYARYVMLGLYSHTDISMTLIHNKKYDCLRPRCEPEMHSSLKGFTLWGCKASWHRLVSSLEIFMDVNELSTSAVYYSSIISTSDGNSHSHIYTTAGCVNSSPILDELVYISLPKPSRLLRHVNGGLLQGKYGNFRCKHLQVTSLTGKWNECLVYMIRDGRERLCERLG